MINSLWKNEKNNDGRAYVTLFWYKKKWKNIYKRFKLNYLSFTSNKHITYVIIILIFLFLTLWLKFISPAMRRL